MTSKFGRPDLPQHFAVIVPSTKNFNQPISNQAFKKRVKLVRNKLHRTFGGTTRIRGVGTYEKDKKIAEEKVQIVESYTTKEIFRQNQSKIKEWLQRKAKLWGQDSIGVMIEENLYFISPR